MARRRFEPYGWGQLHYLGAEDQSLGWVSTDSGVCRFHWHSLKLYNQDIQVLARKMAQLDKRLADQRRATKKGAKRG